MVNNYEKWAKENKKAIAREFIRRSTYQQNENPVAIITAGLPGAGKTEFTLGLLKQTDAEPLRIDMDEIAQQIQGYKPQIADKFRVAASEIMNRIYDEVIKKKIDFILDGTFAGSQAINNIIRASSRGYTIKVYYIHQEPKVAWDFTKAREKIEHRAIDKTKFIDTYYKLHENLLTLSKMTDNVTVSAILKKSDNEIGSLEENVSDISQTIPPLLTRIELEAELQ